jgi:hypothetical protein
MQTEIVKSLGREGRDSLLIQSSTGELNHG